MECHCNRDSCENVTPSSGTTPLVCLPPNCPLPPTLNCGTSLAGVSYGNPMLLAKLIKKTMRYINVNVLHVSFWHIIWLNSACSCLTIMLSFLLA